SVWDYPRPPRVEPTGKLVRIEFNGITLAETRHALRVLEKSHPPVYYIPPEDVLMKHLARTPHRSFCEFKGAANYWAVQVGDRLVENAAWGYLDPTPGFEAIKGHLAFYPSKMDACFVDGERVRAQAGDFYGGWITDEIVGPFKGERGTGHW
ncbi:MAG: DUF427 domain-containing protein, partial [Anaerolineae bacterium]|nr:DUF427 domain-containing protein [Anaerolineae bacterium]